MSDSKELMVVQDVGRLQLCRLAFTDAYGKNHYGSWCEANQILENLDYPKSQYSGYGYRIEYDNGSVSNISHQISQAAITKARFATHL